MKLTPVFVEVCAASDPLFIIGLINVGMIGTVQRPKNPYVGPTPALLVSGEVCHIKMSYSDLHKLVGLNPEEGESESKSTAKQLN
jgi:hypothetical protein